jgi:hypothetical protein
MAQGFRFDELKSGGLHKKHTGGGIGQAHLYHCKLTECCWIRNAEHLCVLTDLDMLIDNRKCTRPSECCTSLEN